MRARAATVRVGVKGSMLAVRRLSYLAVDGGRLLLIVVDDDLHLEGGHAFDELVVELRIGVQVQVRVRVRSEVGARARARARV